PDATVDDGSCEYIYGCMDPDATNYNPNATMDDGSCEYEGPGQAMWWINSDLGVGNINIYFRGYYQGQITHYYYTTPDCGANGCVTVSEENGTYSWSAEADDGYTTWSGTIDITGYDCSTMELTINKNGKGEAKLVPSGDGSAIPQPIAH
ncbi:MAG: hypothetical protein PF489_08550, partial [Salinivirgaceae bacterium]|nr:hypothetical protein [Salinivirgaceae bacterium]